MDAIKRPERDRGMTLTPPSPRPRPDHKRVKLIYGNMYIMIYNCLINVLFSYMQMQ